MNWRYPCMSGIASLFTDSCIIAAALLADCDTLWTEDMHHGLVIDGCLMIRNPFA